MMLPRLALVAGLLSAASPRIALAQDMDTQQAKEHFDAGQNLYLQGQFVEASERFIEAYQTKPFAAFLFNIAVCFEKNKDYQKALDHYERFYAADPHSRDRDLVKKRITAIRKYLNPPTPGGATQPMTRPTEKPVLPKLPPVRTKGLVVIESNPEGAAIYLGDKKDGIFTRTPYTGSLPPGQTTLLLELKEFKLVRKTVFVRHDRLSYLYFALSRQTNLGWIEVKGNIGNAQIYFDKKQFGAIGQTPYSGHLRPGKRKLIIEREGYEPFVRELDIIAGKTHVVDFQLERVDYGWIKVTGKTTRGATVEVNDKPVACPSYPCRTQISPGQYKVKVKRDGFKTYSTTIDVERTQEVKVAVRLNPKPSRMSAYVSFGVATALLATGIAAGVISNKRKSSVEDDLNNGVLFDDDDNRLFEGKVAAIVANSLFGLAGVAAGLGLYYMFRNVGPDSYGETDSRQIAVTPIFGPNVAGLGGAVRF